LLLDNNIFIYFIRPILNHLVYLTGSILNLIKIYLSISLLNIFILTFFLGSLFLIGLAICFNELHLTLWWCIIMFNKLIVVPETPHHLLEWIDEHSLALSLILFKLADVGLPITIKHPSIAMHETFQVQAFVDFAAFPHGPADAVFLVFVV
jgi:hypothetical protein